MVETGPETTEIFDNQMYSICIYRIFKRVTEERDQYLFAHRNDGDFITCLSCSLFDATCAGRAARMLRNLKAGK